MRAEATICPAGHLDLFMSSDLLAVTATMAQAFHHPPLRDIPPDLRDTAEMVLVEVLTNVVKHAHTGPIGQIHLHIERAAIGLICTLRDNGMPMPLGMLPPGRFPDTDAQGYPAEGGYGWYLIRAFAQNLSYHRQSGENCLSFELNAQQDVDPQR